MLLIRPGSLVSAPGDSFKGTIDVRQSRIRVTLFFFSKDKRGHGTSYEKQKIHNVSMAVKIRGNLHYSFSY